MGIEIGGETPYIWAPDDPMRTAFADGDGIMPASRNPAFYRPRCFAKGFMIPDDRDTYIPTDIVIENGNGAVMYAHKSQTKGRGNTTWGAPKKPFKVRSANRSQRPFDYAPSRDWAFMADAHDNSYLRTSVGYELARQATGRWAPYSHHIWLNWNGVDQGLYRWSETADLQVGRVNFREMKDGDTSGNKLTGPYYVEVDEVWDDPGFRTTLDTPYMYDTPDVVGNLQQEDYIMGWFDMLEDAFVDGREWQMLSLMDVQSWVDWYLLQEFCKNADSKWFKSIKHLKDQDPPAGTGKVVMWPPWDFDRTMAGGSGGYDGWITRNGPGANGVSTPGARPNMMYYAWEKSPQFRAACRQTWFERFVPAIPKAIEHMYELSAEIEPWIAPDRALWYGGTALPFDHTPAAIEAWMLNRRTWMSANL